MERLPATAAATARHPLTTAPCDRLRERGSGLTAWFSVRRSFGLRASAPVEGVTPACTYRQDLLERLRTYRHADVPYYRASRPPEGPERQLVRHLGAARESAAPISQRSLTRDRSNRVCKPRTRSLAHQMPTLVQALPLHPDGMTLACSRHGERSGFRCERVRTSLWPHRERTPSATTLLCQSVSLVPRAPRPAMPAVVLPRRSGGRTPRIILPAPWTPPALSPGISPHTPSRAASSAEPQSA